MARIVFISVFICLLISVPVSFPSSKSYAFTFAVFTRQSTHLRETSLKQRWRDLLIELKPLGEKQKLTRVNDFFNRSIQFSSDTKVWGQNDYWATPLETIEKTKGDCEDFTIAKYVSLLKLEVPMDKLRLTYVKAQIATGAKPRTQAHMVLAFYDTPYAEPLILDNLSFDIRPASKRKDLFPVFSFNGGGLWLGQARSAKTNNPGARLSRWQDMLNRMDAEGVKTP